MKTLKYIQLIKLTSTDCWTVICAYDDGTSDNLGEVPKHSLNICGSFLTVWENADSVYFYPQSEKHKLNFYLDGESRVLSILDSEWVETDVVAYRKNRNNYQMF
jgi:hypothetical protein